MGYTTDFHGSLNIDPPLPPALVEYINLLAKTRRVKRALDPIYGEEGEFYAVDDGDWGQSETADILNYNAPAYTQPGLWLQWNVNADGTELEWDGGESFYNYIDWLVYMARVILLPLGHRLIDGGIEWRGAEWDDTGELLAEGDMLAVVIDGERKREFPIVASDDPFKNRFLKFWAYYTENR